MTTATTVERAAIAVAAGIAAVVTAAALAVHPDPDVAPCGYVAEDHVTAPAYCGDPAELHARLDALHVERSGDRFAPITAPSDGPAPAAYGPDRDPDTSDYAPGWTYADGAERAARAYGRDLPGVTVTPRKVTP